MKAAIYARVSTADGRQDEENQLAQLRQFAATQGWEIVGEYIDNESTSRADPEFRRLLADAAQRRFDALLAWTLDRLRVIALMGATAKPAHRRRSSKPVGRPRAVFCAEEAIALRNSGLSWRQIASKLKVGMTTVRRACNGGSTPCQNSQGGSL